MIPFARLLDTLVYAPQRTTKMRLLADYFARTPDPDRGWALAALTGTLELRHAKPALIRALAAERVDAVLFELSYDYVGDLAETVALIWPERAPAPGAADAAETPTPESPTLGAVIAALRGAGAPAARGLIAGWLDQLDATGRWALIKLVTRGLRVGVSARLAKAALAEAHDVDLALIEEVWHGIEAPYGALFAWLEGRAPKPEIGRGETFLPMMLATALDAGELERLDPGQFTAEWKWDGIRVQIAARDGRARLYSRTGEDVAPAFPDLVAAVDFDAVLDGELLVRGAEGTVGSFNELQQRLNRKTPTRAQMAAHPAFVRLYDILFDGPEDLRELPFEARRRRLETFLGGRPASDRFDLSPLLAFADWADLARRRARPPAPAIEGVMLKRRDSPYLGGRPKGPWFKWKRDPLTIDAVLMYAQRGHGRRSSFYSDFTFGCWRADPGSTPALVPVGKAYFGFTDDELKRLDGWVRAHTTQSFGPVREVAPALVCELAFDGVQRSTRHKSGLALRFPRIARIRWDKPAAEADMVAALERLLGLG